MSKQDFIFKLKNIERTKIKVQGIVGCEPNLEFGM